MTGAGETLRDRGLEVPPKTILPLPEGRSERVGRKGSVPDSRPSLGSSHRGLLKLLVIGTLEDCPWEGKIRRWSPRRDYTQVVKWRRFYAGRDTRSPIRDASVRVVREKDLTL